jgi:hypothetical protein
VSYFPDDHPAFDMPEFNPEPIEAEFPVDPDLVYVGTLRLRLLETWVGGELVKCEWECPHGKRFSSTTEAVIVCGEQHGDCEVP